MQKAAVVALLALLLAGCGHTFYYVIEDAQTQQKYLTTEYHNDGEAIRFKDELTGDTMKVRAYVLHAISREEYEDAKRNRTAPDTP